MASLLSPVLCSLVFPSLHNIIAKFIKMDGEKEDYIAYGDTLMNAGVHLKQGFAGTGYNDEVRFYQDFGSRMYLMQEEILV